MLTTRVAWEDLRTLDAATFDAMGSTLPIGDPLEFPSYTLKIVNNSNVLVTISMGGEDKDVVPANSFVLYDESKTSFHEMIPARTQIYATGSTGVGNIYVVSQYIVER